MGSEYATGGTLGKIDGNLGGDRNAKVRRKKGLVKAAVDWVIEWVGETGVLPKFGRGDKSRSF